VYSVPMDLSAINSLHVHQSLQLLRSQADFGNEDFRLDTSPPVEFFAQRLHSHHQKYAFDDDFLPSPTEPFLGDFPTNLREFWLDFRSSSTVAADTLHSSTTSEDNVVPENVEREEFQLESGDVAQNDLSNPKSEDELPNLDDQVLHVCPVQNCGRRYKHKGDLKFHCREKHRDFKELPGSISGTKSTKDGKTYACPVHNCPCGYKWKRDLRRHLFSKHPEVEANVPGKRLRLTKPIQEVTFDKYNMCKFDIFEKI